MRDELRSRFVLLFNLVENIGLVKSRAEAACRLNYRPQAFNEVLKGRTNVGIDLIQKFCIEFGANPEYIILGSGDYFKEKNQNLNVKLKSSGKVRGSRSKSGGKVVEASDCERCNDKNLVIAAMEKTILAQENQIATLREMVDLLKKQM
ncbi:MAG TPA: hypothetical protein VMW01_13915 [Williamwhitmania sp.]|nr:hypothetical protein [Williamwhitmania sp.]